MSRHPSRSQSYPTKKGEWLTNVGKSGLKGLWPRRDVPLVEGPPKQVSPAWPLAKLQERGFKGIYLAEDLVKPYREYPTLGTRKKS